VARRRVAVRDPRPGEPVQELLPEDPSLPAVREVSRGCKACHLYLKGTQTVFGEGPARAEIMLVGEQPGDAEDLAGHPFVGPAGKLLDRALEEAGIERSRVYVTNVVKHFKWEPRGKRRIHAKPNAAEIGACRPWLETELALVKPRVLGRAFKVTQMRGQFVESPLAPLATATVHPSSILRAPDDESRRRETQAFVADLKKVAARLSRSRS
jgi:uracil-DNA glycosylase family protein